MKNIVMLGGKRRSGKDFSGEMLINLFGFKRVSFGEELKNHIYKLLGIDFSVGESMKNNDEIIKISFTDFSNSLDNMIKEMCVDQGVDYSVVEELYEEYNIEISHDVCSDGFTSCLLKEMKVLSKFDVFELDIILDINVRLALQWCASYMKKIFGDDVWAKYGLKKVLDCETDNVVITDFRFPYEDFSGFLGTHLVDERLNIVTIEVLGKNRYHYDPLIDSHESETALKDYKFDYVLNNTVHGEPSILTVQLKAILNERGITWRM